MNLSMRLYTRQGVFYVEFGRGRAVSLRTRSRAEALAAFQRLKRDRFRQRVAVLEGRPIFRLEDFAREYLEYSQGAKAPATCRTDRLALNKLMDYCGPSKKLGAIGLRDLEKFLAHLRRAGLRETSIAVYYRHLKAAFSKAKSWGYLRENPFAALKEPRGQQAPPRYLRPEEIGRLLAAEPDPAFRRLWQFYLWSGVRRGEALALTWRHIDRSRDLISVPHTKNRRPKLVRLTPQLAAILRELPGDVGRLFPWTPDAVSHHFKKTARRAGLDCRLHDLRHTFASYLLMSGARLEHVKDLLGHKDLKATQIYAHLDREHLDAALSKLDFSDKKQTGN